MKRQKDLDETFSAAQQTRIDPLLLPDLVRDLLDWCRRRAHSTRLSWKEASISQQSAEFTLQRNMPLELLQVLAREGACAGIKF